MTDYLFFFPLICTYISKHPALADCTITELFLGENAEFTKKCPNILTNFLSYDKIYPCTMYDSRVVRYLVL